MNDNTLDITLTREMAFQLLMYLAIIQTIAGLNPNYNANSLESHSTAELIRQIQDFVEGKSS